jgi:hypothetical protein
MAFYRAKVRCYVDNTIRNADDEFEYNGPLNTNLELVDGEEADDAGEGVKARAPKRTPKPKAE